MVEERKYGNRGSYRKTSTSVWSASARRPCGAPLVRRCRFECRMNPFIRGLVDVSVVLSTIYISIIYYRCHVVYFGVQPLAEIAEPIEIGVRHTPFCVRFVLC